jgi:hypothetical protein
MQTSLLLSYTDLQSNVPVFWSLIIHFQGVIDIGISRSLCSKRSQIGTFMRKSACKPQSGSWTGMEQITARGKAMGKLEIIFSE